MLIAALLAGAASPLAAQQAAAPAPAPQAAIAAPTKSVPPSSPEAKRLYTHVATLSDDAMRGREAGTPDFDRAAAYVADQFKAIGATPAGTDGWYQPVPLVAYRLKAPTQLSIVDGGKVTPLTLGTDFISGGTGGKARSEVEAQVVYVGQGIYAPKDGVDDYAGVDVRGKIVAFAIGAPESLQGEMRAHMQSITSKALEAKRRGAIGVSVLLPQGFDLADAANSWQEPQVTWRTPEGQAFSAHGLPGVGALSPAMALRLFGADAKPGTVSKAKLRSVSEAQNAPLESRNVVALLPGSDPALKNEYVVLTAHLDHVGVGDPVNGDAIYNGAMDNSVGVGSMIEAGRALKAAGHKRPILLVALTAEEKGLVGSDYFARHPVVPIGNIVADVNLDMPIITYPFTDMFAFGADRSSLGPLVKAALQPLGITLTPDPDPSQALFVRSDHYSFIKQGVPSLFLKTGFAGAGAEATKLFRSTHYHKPSDTIALPIDWESGGKFIRANTAIAKAIADAPQRPSWNAGDYFGETFGKPAN